MQIVIDIPSKKYQSILAHKVEIEDDSSFIEPKYLYKAIINGTPLPKRYGRLVDVDKIIHTTVYNAYTDEWEDKEMSILDFVNAYTDEGISEAVIDRYFEGGVKFD